MLLELYHGRLPEDVRRAIEHAISEAESIRNSVLLEEDPVARALAAWARWGERAEAVPAGGGGVREA